MAGDDRESEIRCTGQAYSKSQYAVPRSPAPRGECDRASECGSGEASQSGSCVHGSQLSGCPRGLGHGVLAHDIYRESIQQEHPEPDTDGQPDASAEPTEAEPARHNAQRSSREPEAHDEDGDRHVRVSWQLIEREGLEHPRAWPVRGPDPNPVQPACSYRGDDDDSCDHRQDPRRQPESSRTVSELVRAELSEPTVQWTRPYLPPSWRSRT